jgi:hypothetical protein
VNICNKLLHFVVLMQYIQGGTLVQYKRFLDVPLAILHTSLAFVYIYCEHTYCCEVNQILQVSHSIQETFIFT